jgi:hypothetical protein
MQHHVDQICRDRECSKRLRKKLELTKNGNPSANSGSGLGPVIFYSSVLISNQAGQISVQNTTAKKCNRPFLKLFAVAPSSYLFVPWKKPPLGGGGNKALIGKLR